MVSRLITVTLIILPLSTSLAVTDVATSTQTIVHQDAPVTLDKEGPDVVISPQILHDTLQIEDAPTNINKDTGIFLYGDPKSKKPAVKK